MHVMVDGRRREGGEAWTEWLVHCWLDRAVSHSGLLVIAGPQVKQFQGHIHGWAMIAESHIKAQLDVERGLAWLEMFSCKWFSEPEFVTLCVEMFGLEGPEVKMLERSLP